MIHKQLESNWRGLWNSESDPNIVLVMRKMFTHFITEWPASAARAKPDFLPKFAEMADALYDESPADDELHYEPVDPNVTSLKRHIKEANLA